MVNLCLCFLIGYSSLDPPRGKVNFFIGIICCIHNSVCAYGINRAFQCLVIKHSWGNNIKIILKNTWFWAEIWAIACNFKSTISTTEVKWKIFSHVSWKHLCLWMPLKNIFHNQTQRLHSLIKTPFPGRTFKLIYYVLGMIGGNPWMQRKSNL